MESGAPHAQPTKLAGISVQLSGRPYSAWVADCWSL